MSLNETILRLTTDGRTVARGIGILGILSWMRKILNKVCGKNGYESRFDDAMRKEIKKGDVVWDIGANVGLYTKIFSNLVGENGIVCAFEPTPTCFLELQRNCTESKNVHFFNLALGKKEENLAMSIAEDPLGATHSLVNSTPSNKNVSTIEVKVTDGDKLISKDNLPFPQVIKIDVEGYEEEVLCGLRQTLLSSKCRAIFCEVHFTILASRGERHAPVRIQKLLKEAGFKTRWIDASHLGAYKNQT